MPSVVLMPSVMVEVGVAVMVAVSLGDVVRLLALSPVIDVVVVMAVVGESASTVFEVVAVIATVLEFVAVIATVVVSGVVATGDAILSGVAAVGMVPAGASNVTWQALSRSAMNIAGTMIRFFI